MDEPFQVTRLIQSAFTLLWILVYFASAGLAFFRFRTTASGLLCGGVFLLFAFKLILFKLFNYFILPAMSGGPDAGIVASFISYFLSFLFCLILAVGIGLIPRSLRILSEKT